MSISPNVWCRACRCALPRRSILPVTAAAPSSRRWKGGRSRSKAIRVIRRAWVRPTCSRKPTCLDFTIRTARRPCAARRKSSPGKPLAMPCARKWKWNAGAAARVCELSSGRVTSPTLARQRDALLKDFPQARWIGYEPVSDDDEREGARLAFGRPLTALPRIERCERRRRARQRFSGARPGADHKCARLCGRRGRRRPTPSDSCGFTPSSRAHRRPAPMPITGWRCGRN